MYFQAYTIHYWIVRTAKLDCSYISQIGRKYKQSISYTNSTELFFAWNQIASKKTDTQTPFIHTNMCTYDIYIQLYTYSYAMYKEKLKIIWHQSSG